MAVDIENYHKTLSPERQKICEQLSKIINGNLAYTERKVWHGHPVWFIEDNPIVGYSSLKDGIKLMFWSGASFTADGLAPGTGKFKDASMLYADVKDIVPEDVQSWLKESEEVQWDYKNIVKRKGILKRLK